MSVISKNIKRTLLLVIGLTLSTLSSADPWLTANVAQLYPSVDGYVFMTSNGNSEFSSCSGGKRFKVALDHPNYDALVGTLLLAFSTDSTIKINIDGEQYTSPVCAPTINRLLMYK